jgi:eukaryotic-like serine/threonine-protein kinase
MGLLVGTRLGSYEIIATLGAGGMGEVYRARDTKLKRTVAVKVLPEAFANDADRLMRFQREAELLATLNHPNIAAIYGLEESSGQQALVLELVEGPTLADRIKQGPLPLEEVLGVAAQIADALEAAHAAGVIHRDLKPANIKLRSDGTVKVLDFGLAKAFDKTQPRDATQSPTMLSPAPTHSGVILGTAMYMAPEQARGKPVDTRSDVWAFGCVLFEMLTGARAFDGATFTDAIAAIVTKEPDWRTLPAGTPHQVRSLVARCLKKDPVQRLRDIADGRFQIEEALNESATSGATSSTGSRRRERAAWVAVVLSAGAALLLALRPSAKVAPPDPISFPVFPPEHTTFSGSANTTVNVPSFALSPDGRTLVFSAKAPERKPTLWLRSLDRLAARELAGTDDAQDPMWSPDSLWVGFFADGKLKKIPAAGGAVQVITQAASDFRGGTWNSAGTILFSMGTDPILSVDSAGGTTTPVTAFDKSRQETIHRYPRFLPDGRHFLYAVMGHQEGQNGVYAASLDGKIKKLLIPINTSAVYAPPGHLLYVDGDSLLGQAFDVARLELVGQPFLVAEHAGRNTAFMAAVSASQAGAIAYAGIIPQSGRLTWIDRTGTQVASSNTPEGDYTDFRLSPDETRVAASLLDPRTNSVTIWLTDLARNTTSRLSPGGLITAAAVWSPDGTRLAFRTNRNGMIEFFERSTAGGGEDRPVLSAAAHRAAKIPTFNMIPTDWQPDGRQVIFSAPTRETSFDLWLLPMGDAGTPVRFITSPGEQMHGNFSPDGRLVAYTSNESGRFDVYVETVPRSDRKWSVSANGGYEPRWRGDGREIYYLSGDRKLMSVAVGAGPSFGSPQALFQTQVPVGITNNRTHYVPTRDGRRFLVNTALDAPAPSINVVVNWTATIKK